jgi:serine/threonine protein kinase
VTIYDIVTDGEQTWIVMEPLFGRTLADMIGGDGRLSVTLVTDIGLRLLDVLQAAHGGGIVHCDVKPANVHLCDSGRVVLTDFGIAHRIREGAAAGPDFFAGSPGYTAPERLRGHIPEPASDFFSLGATLFAAVEGRPPFRGGSSLVDAVFAVVEGEPASFLHAGPLQPIIEGLLVKDPAHRLTGEQARTALDECRRQLG